MKSLKVLVAAYACDPYRGSDLGVGWGWARAAARNHEVWVLTADWERKSIERFVAAEPDECRNMHVVFVTPRLWHYTEPHWFWSACESSLLKPVVNWSYRRWQWDAYKTAQELHRKIGFDLAHQMTFVSFRFPGHLWKLDLPFVWGPIGGLENTPWRLLPWMGAGGAVYYGARNVVNSAHRRFLRSPRRAFASAGSGVIAATSGIRREIRRWYGIDAEVICEVGPPPQIVDRCERRAASDPLRIAWSGRHLPGKALQLLLRALSRMPDGLDWRLDIFGDGPCYNAWRKLAGRLEISSRCAWRGQVSREEALRGLRLAHVFVVTSLKDLTSTVILEALAQGVPVICPDHCGFSDVITDECGMKLPISSPREFEQALTPAILSLAFDEDRRRWLSAGALRRARELSWEAKADALDRIYRRVIETRESKALDATVLARGDAEAYS